MFLFYLTVPIYFKVLSQKNSNKLFFLSFIISFFNFTGFLSLNLYFKYLAWFLAGNIYFKNFNKINTNIKKYGIFYIFVFATLFVSENFLFFNLNNEIKVLIKNLVIPAFSIPVILWLSFYGLKNSRLLTEIGRNSFSIYLQNMTIVGIIYLIFVKIFKFDAYILQFCVPVFLSFSIMVPLLLKKLLNESQFIYKLLGYID